MGDKRYIHDITSTSPSLVDSECIAGLANAFITLLSLADMFKASDYGYFNHLGTKIATMYEMETFSSSPEFDEGWQKVTEHLVDVFSCMAGGDGKNLSLLGSSYWPRIFQWEITQALIDPRYSHAAPAVQLRCPAQRGLAEGLLHRLRSQDQVLPDSEGKP